MIQTYVNSADSSPIFSKFAKIKGCKEAVYGKNQEGVVLQFMRCGESKVDG